MIKSLSKILIISICLFLCACSKSDTDNRNNNILNEMPPEFKVEVDNDNTQDFKIANIKVNWDTDKICDKSKSNEYEGKIVFPTINLTNGTNNYQSIFFIPNKKKLSAFALKQIRKQLIKSNLNNYVFITIQLPKEIRNQPYTSLTHLPQIADFMIFKFGDISNYYNIALNSGTLFYKCSNSDLINVISALSPTILSSSEINHIYQLFERNDY